MKSSFKITIPKPCHENWNAMTLKEKGRFCSSCSKTVVDFTKKSTEEIQDYLIENKNQKVCGHFYKKQLDTIVIEIPEITFQQQLSFQKLFILALFFVMGTTLFSCQYSDGKKQKIENVIVKDSIEIIDKNIKLITKEDKSNDSLNCIKNIDLTTTGDVDEVIIDGMIETEGEVILEEDEIIMGMIIEEHPRFKEAKNLSILEAKKDFEKRIQQFIETNFKNDSTINLGLKKGKYKILSQFTIDKTGKVTDIKVRAPHIKLKKEVTKIIQKLPQFIPGKQAGKIVKTSYNLPISFVVD